MYGELCTKFFTAALPVWSFVCVLCSLIICTPRKSTSRAFPGSQIVIVAHGGCMENLLMSPVAWRSDVLWIYGSVSKGCTVRF